MISQHTNYTVVHCERFRTLDHHYSVLSSLASFRLSPVLSFFFTSSRFEPGTAASAAVPLSTDANEKSRQFKNTTPEMCEDPAEPFVCPRYPPPASPDNLERFPRLAQCAGKILAKDLALRETKNRERARLPVLSGLMGTLCPPLSGRKSTLLEN